PVFNSRRDATLAENQKEGYTLDRYLSLIHNRAYKEKIRINQLTFWLDGIRDDTIKQLYLGQDVDLLTPADFKHEPITANTTVFRMVHASDTNADAVKYHWSNIALTEKEQLVEEAIRLIEPNFVKGSLLGRVGPERLHVQLRDKAHPYPIDRLGEGMNRLIGLVLALFNSQGGFLLIDELENGLHYSVIPKVWEYLFHFARELDVQIFATTHSRDCVEAFAKVANQPNASARMIRLYADSTGITQSETFSSETIQAALQLEEEVR
ncbi:MAG: AAA family ATPase, partial [Bacteroidota bacterium]